MRRPLPDPRVTVLGPDPAHRTYVLNGNAFQQDVLVTLNAWQYACFYSPLSVSAGGDPTKPKQNQVDEEPLYVHVARRWLPDGPWEVLVLSDYAQTVDDGHNTVQVGVCAGDGTIHLSYDHHCDVLRYRHSVKNLATNPADFPWTPSLFSPTLSHLPGLPPSHPHFCYVTYPRFISPPSPSSSPGPQSSDLFFSFRTGKAGLGDDHLYVYSPTSGSYTFVGTHLTGVANNPYVHGMDFGFEVSGRRLHVTWVYRGFVWYEGWDDPEDTKHKMQAGPNGAENNYDLCYAYSDWDDDDGGGGRGGKVWRNNDGVVVADLSLSEYGDDSGGKGMEGKEVKPVASTIKPDAPGIVVQRIPKGSGLTNQESQAVDQDGGIHVLNRTFDDGEGGPGEPVAMTMWRHFYRGPKSGTWDQRTIGPVTGGKRGRLAVSKTGDLLLLLPDSSESTLRILRSEKKAGYQGYEEVWKGKGLSGEPLVDVSRLRVDDGVLSVFARRDVEGQAGRKDVVVMDFDLSMP